MLDKKDQIIFENLTHNCRISTTKLSKLTKLSQSTVVYRIQRLEKEGYISGYDAILQWDMLPLPVELFFVQIPINKLKSFEQEITKNKAVTGLFHLLHKMNYALLTFLTDKERKQLIKYFEQIAITFETHVMSKETFIPFSVYDIPIKMKNKPVKRPKKIDLDEKDVKIVTVLGHGGGRDSMLELARKTKLTYDVVMYRFKKLQKQGFFPLFLAQPSRTKFHTQVDMLLIKTKNTSYAQALQIFEKAKKIPYLLELEQGTFFTQIFAKTFEEYKQVLEIIADTLGDNLLDWEVYNVKDWMFVNRYPLEKIVRK